jgi:hypothetical protein
MYAGNILGDYWDQLLPIHHGRGIFMSRIFSGIASPGPGLFLKMFDYCAGLFQESSRTLPDFFAKVR